MSFVRVCRLPVVLLLIVSLASSGRWASATERVVGNPTDPNRVVRDVRLTPEGALRVRAVDTNGQPIPSGTVQLRRNGISVAVETTDDEGTLSIWGLKGGVYEIEMEGNLQMCRVWSATTAPPAAINSVS